ncbi:hypothetical protein WT83_18190 [Burkholderia territorii]|uniref:Uncharacterized protein n=1 Tax=Burkholderia territorii TaxID=1503055 RepID=A0A108EMW9_9BURK|nr:hypothetical protein [Burkholderia territorii]KWN14377.1 hypothetical protein WT83_18190 [Burkholderia territorii]
MNQRNETLMALDGALAPLLAVVATATDGAAVFNDDGTTIRAQSPFELASIIRSNPPVAIAKREGAARWAWGFPGWEKYRDELQVAGFGEHTGISDKFLELAGFDRQELAKELAVLESLGHVAFVVRIGHAKGGA